MIQNTSLHRIPLTSDSLSEPVVLCAADDHYARSLTVTLQSAAEFLRPGHSLQVIVMDGGIQPENWQRMKESLASFPVQLHMIRPDPQVVDGLTTSHHITRTAYFRLLAGKLLPESIDRVIYLDSDLLVRDDLSLLWEMELENEYCLAVPDIACPHIDAREANCNFRKSNPYLAAISPIPNWRELNLEGSDGYFNSGVMVLNIDRWRRESIEKRLLQCLQENRKHVWCWDQYALNVVFAGQWRALPARWNQGAHLFDFPDENHSPIDRAEFIEARDNPAIIHYTTEWKPWHFHNQHPHRDLFFQQLDKTAWGGWRPERPPFRISDSWNRLAVQLIKSTTTTFRKVRSLGNRNDAPPSPAGPTRCPARPAVTKRASKLDAQPLVTLFAVPKSFEGKNETIQENAIRSWRSLEPVVEVLLVGDDPGVAEAAQRLGVRHLPGIETNEQGTPLLSSAFRLAEQQSQAPLLMYSNCDIIYLDDLLTTFEQLATQSRLTEYLGIGRRTDLQVDDLIDFEDRSSVEKLEYQLEAEGTPAAIVCKDYFIFPKGVFSDLPEFAVGRGNWDNWMVHSAKQRDIPVVNLSQSLRAVHQEHDYTHTRQSRRECYATGTEARKNQQLGGGRHLISGSTSTWSLGKNGLQRLRPGFTSREFWLDIPRFAHLLARLFWSK
ncbi:MAG: glycosyltransferase family 8 protein [Mariniblastus sp.]|nr:glycosyltransferase family 8 protein [Mariniblastus sp.]